MDPIIINSNRDGIVGLDGRIGLDGGMVGLDGGMVGLDGLNSSSYDQQTSTMFNAEEIKQWTSDGDSLAKAKKFGPAAYCYTRALELASPSLETLLRSLPKPEELLDDDDDNDDGDDDAVDVGEYNIHRSKNNLPRWFHSVWGSIHPSQKAPTCDQVDQFLSAKTNKGPLATLRDLRVPILTRRSLLWEDRRDLNAALQDALEAVGWEPLKPKPYLRLVSCLRFRGDYVSCIRLLDVLYEDPRFARARPSFAAVFQTVRDDLLTTGYYPAQWRPRDLHVSAQRVLFGFQAHEWSNDWQRVQEGERRQSGEEVRFASESSDADDDDDDDAEDDTGDDEPSDEADEILEDDDEEPCSRRFASSEDFSDDNVSNTSPSTVDADTGLMSRISADERRTFTILESFAPDMAIRDCQGIERGNPFSLHPMLYQAAHASFGFGAKPRISEDDEGPPTTRSLKRAAAHPVEEEDPRRKRRSVDPNGTDSSDDAEDQAESPAVRKVWSVVKESAAIRSPVEEVVERDWSRWGEDEIDDSGGEKDTSYEQEREKIATEILECCVRSTWRPRTTCRRYTGHLNELTDIKEATYWDNDSVIGASDGGLIFVWRRQDGTLLQALQGHADSVNCVQVHPTEAILASSGIDDYIQLWRPDPAAWRAPSGSSDDEDQVS